MEKDDTERYSQRWWLIWYTVFSAGYWNPPTITVPEGTLQTQPWFQNNGENDESGVVISECNSNQWSSLLLTINIKTERACKEERREAFILSTFPFQTLTNMVISSAWSLPCTNNHHGITQKVIYKHIPDFRSMVRVMRVLWMERIIRDHSCS